MQQDALRQHKTTVNVRSDLWVEMQRLCSSPHTPYKNFTGFIAHQITMENERAYQPQQFTMRLGD